MAAKREVLLDSVGEQQGEGPLVLLLQRLIRELGEEQAAAVGHDWGSMVAWNTALLRPEVVRGVVGISVPPLPRGPLPPLTVAKQRFGEGFHQNYFQEPGVADAAFDKDVAATLRLIYCGIPDPEPSDGFLGSTATSTATGS
ncbi:alpha/beta fold hydrolase [Streptomyces olivaceoviridis]